MLKTAIKFLKIIHIAFCTGIIIMYLIFGFDALKSLYFPDLNSSNFVYVLIPIAAYILSDFLFKLELKKIEPLQGLNKKFVIYQTASIFRWTVLEIAAFLILFLYPRFIILGVFIIIYMMYLRPSNAEFKEHNKL